MAEQTKSYVRRAGDDDEAMVRDQSRWPVRPLLPLKRRAAESAPGEFPECGTLVDPDFHPAFGCHRHTVFLFLVSDPPETVGGVIASPKIEYADFAEMFADGWVVD